MRSRTGVWTGAIVAALGLAGGLSWAFLGSDTAAHRAASAPVRKILASPRSYDGDLVVVTGSVSAVYNRGAITLGGPQRPGLLVTARDIPAMTTVRPNAVVRVRGVVTSFDVAAWEQRTGVHTDLGLLRTFAGRPVIRAKSIVRIGPPGLTQQPASPAVPSLQPSTTG